MCALGPNSSSQTEGRGHMGRLSGKHGASGRGVWNDHLDNWSDGGLDDREQKKEQAWDNLSLVWGLEISECFWRG